MLRIRHGRFVVTFLDGEGKEPSRERAIRYAYVHQITLREVV